MFTVKVSFKDNSESKFQVTSTIEARKWMVKHPDAKIVRVFDESGFTCAMWERVTGKRMRSFTWGNRNYLLRKVK